MSKKTIDVTKIASQVEEKTNELNKIDELISREKKESSIEVFKVARKIAFKELKKLQKMMSFNHLKIHILSYFCKLQAKLIFI